LRVLRFQFSVAVVRSTFSQTDNQAENAEPKRKTVKPKT
jgi:hypothetical protein